MSSKRFGYIFTVICLVLTITGCGGGGSGSGMTDLSGGSGIGVLPPASDGSGGSAGVTGVAALSWNAPTTNTDGSNLSDLAGYRIYYGSAPGAYKGYLDVGNRANYSISLAPGTYYFAVTAYTASGNESVPSNEVSKTIS